MQIRLLINLSETLSKLNIDALSTPTPMPSTYSPHFHTLSTVFWQISNADAIGGRSWFGYQVRICAASATWSACLILSIGLDPQLRHRITSSHAGREQIADMRVINIDYYPREARLAIFRDPWSFPTLFHPACNNLVRRHLEELARKVCGTSNCALLPASCVLNLFLF
jgi:hypothetical protein